MQTYAEIRDKIEDGYIVFFKAEKLTQKAICWVTGGEYSHTGILFWMYDVEGHKRLMLLESHSGGCRIVNFSAYAGRACEIVGVGLSWRDVSDYSLAKTGVVKYGLIEFPAIALRDVLVRMDKAWLAKRIKDLSTSEVCSECVADILAYSGFDMRETLLSPNTLRNVLRARNMIQCSDEVIIG